MYDTEALRWHLAYNVYPPVPDEMLDRAVEFSLDVLDRANAGLWDEQLDERVGDKTVADFIEDMNLGDLVVAD